MNSMNWLDIWKEMSLKYCVVTCFDLLHKTQNYLKLYCDRTGNNHTSCYKNLLVKNKAIVAAVYAYFISNKKIKGAKHA